MASYIKINCPRCKEPARVALTMGVSSQRCDNCGNFFYGADTGQAIVPRRKKGRRIWRSIFTTKSSVDAQMAVDPDSLVHGQRRLSNTWVPIMIVAAILATIWITYSIIGLEKRRGSVTRAAADDLVEQSSLEGKVISGKATVNDKRLSMGDFAPLAAEIDPVWAGKVADVAQKFLASKDINELLKLIRNAPQFESQIRKELEPPGKLPLSLEGIDDLLYSPNDANEKSPLALLFFKNREETVQGIVLTDTKDNGILVDWPSLSGCGDMSLEEFLQKKPTEPTLLRVAARKIDYYNFEYLDKERLQGLRMTEYPEKTVVYGYVHRQAAFFKKINPLGNHDPAIPDYELPKPRPLTIKANFRKDTKSPNQVEVIEVLGNGWYVQ